MKNHIIKERINRQETFFLPLGFSVLHVGEQHQQSHVWLSVPTDLHIPKHNVTFFVVGTGDFVPPEWVHAGTYISEDKFFVWHIYYKIEE